MPQYEVLVLAVNFRYRRVNGRVLAVLDKHWLHIVPVLDEEVKTYKKHQETLLIILIIYQEKHNFSQCFLTVGGLEHEWIIFPNSWDDHPI